MHGTISLKNTAHYLMTKTQLHEDYYDYVF